MDESVKKYSLEEMYRTHVKNKGVSLRYQRTYEYEGSFLTLISWDIHHCLILVTSVTVLIY